MKFEPTKVPDVIVVEPDVAGDERGFFMETWQAKRFAEGGIASQFVQDNHSRSTQGTLRGLHYQIEQPQGKLVRVVFGEIYDVAVDIRRSSPTFGNWVGEVLSAENRKMLWVPPGFAHGFYVLSNTAEFVYKCTDFYAPEHERTIMWNDPDLAISWPLAGDAEPRLSRKDAEGAGLKEADHYP
ncbi:MAG: dTDP-4-dehydrorhamnose 3,5-epimerase [Gammaproteobacteria bacterium]